MNISSHQVEILHVEDDPIQAALLKRMLVRMSGFSFRIEHVACLRDAIDRLASRHFELCLLDLGLPDSRGVSAVGRIREAAAGMPIVVITGIDDPWAALAALKLGAQDFLVKDTMDAHTLSRALSLAMRGRHEGCASEVIEQGILRMIPDGIVLIDKNNSLVYANPSAQEMLRSNERLVAMAHQSLDTEAQWWGRLVDPIGIERRLLIRLTPVTHQGEPHGLVTMIALGAGDIERTQPIPMNF